MTENDIYQEGRKACPVIPRFENPYPILTPEHDQWGAGWANDRWSLFMQGDVAAVAYCREVTCAIDMGTADQERRRRNPYPEDSVAWFAWRDGWDKWIEDELREQSLLEEDVDS